MRGSLEFELLAQGSTIIGVDEVGRGCLAGPVFAACVALDYRALKKVPKKEQSLIRDSKTLSAKQRASIVPRLHEIAAEYCVSHATVAEIEQIGIVDATFLAITRALANCGVRYDWLLMDGNRAVPGYEGRQKTIVGGDDSCYAIAAASILAKEARDAYMREQSALHPHYGFESNVGYGTKQHLDGIREHGICALHRRNFAPIASMVTPAP